MISRPRLALREALRTRAATSRVARRLYVALARSRYATLHAVTRARRLLLGRALARPVPAQFSLAAVSMPQTGDPVVSIVVPAHGNAELTLRCLESIRRARSSHAFEVVLIDDASPPEEARLLAAVRGVVHVRIDRNVGYQGATTAGVAGARGRILVLLNNDTEVHPGWLDALVEAVDMPGVGAAGARLVYPSGVLQEAGGAILADGSAANVGRGADFEDPRFAFTRDVDYCSAAALAIRRDAWDAVGGFDQRFTPAYYEDADVCFALREHGYRVVYEPRALVTHVEGATHGTEFRPGSSNGKSLQEEHRALFAEKWRGELANHQRRGSPGPLVGLSRRRRPRVCVCATGVPVADRDAGSARLDAILRLLVPVTDRVTLVAADARLPEPATSALRHAGVEVLAGSGALRELGRRGHGTYDAVMFSRLRTATALLGPARRHLRGITVLYDTVDLEYVRRGREAAITGRGGAAARRSFDDELRTMRASDMVVTVSDAEAAVVAELAPGVPTRVLPLVYDAPSVPPAEGLQMRRGLLFVGGFRHSPNADAVWHLVRDVMPEVRATRAVDLVVCGADPPHDILAIARPEDRLVGHVPELTAYIDSARVFVAPLRFGAGVKGKIVQAMIHGLPVVTTSIGAEGMGLVDGRHILVADGAASLAAAIGRLLDDDELWTQIAVSARAVAQERWSSRAMAVRLEALLADLADRP